MSGFYTDVSSLAPASSLSVPAADAVTNTAERDVIGNKSDAAQTVVGTTSAIMAYIKGVLNQLASIITSVAVLAGFTSIEASVATVLAGGSGAKGAYAQAVASTAGAYANVVISVVNTDGGAGNNYYKVDIATGAAASEVVKIADLLCYGGNSLNATFVHQFPFKIPAGTRLSARAANMNSASTPSVKVTIWGLY